MANIQQYDNATQVAVVKINNALSEIMENSQSWKFFITKLPAVKQHQIPNEVFSYVTLHADTVKDLDYNDFMARVVDCYSQGYTLTDGDAFILPFKCKVKDKDTGEVRWVNVATLVPGWVGIKRRAMETGLFRYFTVAHVYEGTIKGYDYRREIPIFDETKIPKGTEKVIGYLGYYEMFSGSKQEIYCSVETLEKHALKYNQQCRKAGELIGTWRDAFDAMCQKTMYRKLGKLAPKTKNPTQQQQQFYDMLETDDEQQPERPPYINVDGVVINEPEEPLPFDEEPLPFDEPPIPEYEAEQPQGYAGNKDTKEFLCADCGAKVSEKVFKYSMDNFGKPLCYNCQKNYK